MAYGGGTFMTQNKTMPGAYIVFASIARASATISDRGVAAAPFALSWGEYGVREITQGEFIRNCWELFGYSYSDDEMLPLREIFKHAVKVFCYRLEGSGAAKADSTFAKARYDGERGNDIKIKVTEIAKTTGDQQYLVQTIVGKKVADEQTLTAWKDIKDNGFVVFKKTVTVKETVPDTYVSTKDTELQDKTYYTVATTTPASADDLADCFELINGEYVKTEDTAIDSSKTYYALTAVDTPSAASLENYYEAKVIDAEKQYRFTKETAETGVDYATTTIGEMAGLVLTGGADGEILTTAHDDFLAAIEPYSFNTLCCPVTNQVVIGQYINHTKEQRDQYGVKFQLVCYKPATADYEGVIGLWNDVTHDTITVSPAAGVYWLTGAEAAAPINGSLTNTKYDGELNIEVKTRQLDLEREIQAGHLVFHRSNGDIVILTDINSLVSLSENFGSMFQKNQTIRYCDNVANDLAALFVKRYLGIVQNDESGRASWWNECVKYFRESQRIRAITEFDEEIVTVDIGDEKDTVVTNINGLNIVNAMEKLYMTVICR